MIELIKKYPNDTDLGRAVRLAYSSDDKMKDNPLVDKVIALLDLVDLYESQIADLTMMSKIELGDDVIAEIKRLKSKLQ